MRSYASYDPAIAMRYVQQVLAQYQKDGLSFQRYLRRDEAGAGGDILAGNSMTIVGLYRDIYGVRPQWNRLRLDPHLTPELEGTKLDYTLRNHHYELTLGMQHSAITAAGFNVRSTGSFAVNATANRLACFPGDQDKPAFTIVRKGTADVTMDIAAWPSVAGGDCQWTMSSAGQPVGLRIIISGLRPHTSYFWRPEGPTVSTVRTDATGSLTLHVRSLNNAVTFALTYSTANSGQ